jgi:hypothetical protein
MRNAKPQATKRIFIVGPMTGHAYFNFPAFDAAEAELHSAGWLDIISPARLDRNDGFSEKSYSNPDDCREWPTGLVKKQTIRRNLDVLTKCDAVYVLRGRLGKGGRAELAVARWLGLKVIRQK